MKNITVLSLTILNLFSFCFYAQQAKVSRADKKYDNYAYIDAIKTYERMAEKGYQSPDMFQKLGNAYFFNAEYDQAAKWYDQLFALKTDVDPVYYYRYAYCLRSAGDTKKADEMLKIYNEKTGNTAKPQSGKTVNYMDQIKANSGRYKVKDAGINSPYSDYGSSFRNGNKLVFTSARDTGSLGQRRHSWTDQYFTNLYESNLTGDSLIPASPVKFDKSVKSRFHEASAIFSKDGKKMYFTRNNYLEGKKGKDGNKVTLVKIYKAELVNDSWDHITELPFNSNNYSCAHPALSSDEKTLYFASDMPGTIGQSDLYKVAINDDGSFGTPQNLGNVINTSGKETFPFVTNENELYFSSDTHPGLGGLDVFLARINPDGTFDEVENVGDGVNSSKDDFAYLIDTKSRIGFFSSNRSGGKGFDDIYQFLETRRLKPKCKPELYGVVTELTTGQVMPNSKVTLFDEMHKAIANMDTDDKGFYSFTNLEFKKTYSVRAEKEDYSTAEKTVTLSTEECKNELNIAFEKALCKVAVGDDLGKCFGIKWIYFDFDKAIITKVAELDLAKILDVMAQYPNMKIDIRSHTDSRGSDKYNEALSERRAKSTKDWLIKNGIAPNRLSSKGYGETKLVNRCSDGVQCTEDEHQQNRRSEFIIMAL
ncbi:OmpA family protein [Flavobacterium gilvum]|uniref:Flagellar motor protein MotB n=1 Tax=Flavobacterium gilvum TaxID=1492737 RepID=A0AAC9N6Z2_9FLAO|nr:OmpA family protein [Flavobacterium gilvum]AOW10259.1 flagellar motor protein MotB [Flavobacterium gilvum]KFC59499.1 cell envelope biogenesis protein OmpA [Flavobacterium gilvum]